MLQEEIPLGMMGQLDAEERTVVCRHLHDMRGPIRAIELRMNNAVFWTGGGSIPIGRRNGVGVSSQRRYTGNTVNWRASAIILMINLPPPLPLMIPQRRYVFDSNPIP